MQKSADAFKSVQRYYIKISMANSQDNRYFFYCHGCQSFTIGPSMRKKMKKNKKEKGEKLSLELFNYFAQ
jgi:hypothetical protein